LTESALALARCVLLPVPVVIDLVELNGTLDLWQCMWQPEEQECFETALVRSMTDAHSPRIRALAFAACNVIATPRMLAAAARVAERGVFPPDELSRMEFDTLPMYKLHDAASRIRGNLQAVEHLVRKVVTGMASPHEIQLLDWVDPRDLVTIARTTVDSRIFGEVEKRIARRGRYQRGRIANVLGFAIRPPVAPASAGRSISGG
jgi:hypothetical protein